MNLKYEIWDEMKKLNCYQEGKFLLKSGQESNFYLNLRNLLESPDCIKKIASLGYQKINLEEDYLVCGLPYAGISYACAFSFLFKKPLLMMRKEVKDHGKKNRIDGLENTQLKKVVVFDDILTTGTSLLEYLPIFEEYGLEVVKVITIIDRRESETDGKPEIIDWIKNGKLECLFRLSEIQNYYQGKPRSPRLPWLDRLKTSSNPMFQKIVSLMAKKKTNLAVSLDFDSWSQIYETAKTIGEHVIIIKIHWDIIKDFNIDKVKDLVKLSRELDFFIFEDRKFSEIGSIFQKQYQGTGDISSWSHLVDFHLIAGPSNLQKYEELYDPDTQGALLVAQMSNHGNLLHDNYTQEVLKIAGNSRAVCGLICQQRLAGENLLYFTPGICLDRSSDGLDQRYRTVKEAIIRDGCDIVIVGRGITQNNNLLESCLRYKNIAWESYLECL